MMVKELEFEWIQRTLEYLENDEREIATSYLKEIRKLACNNELA